LVPEPLRGLRSNVKRQVHPVFRLSSLFPVLLKSIINRYVQLTEARINSYWKFEEKDGGLYLKCESISLTRDIPTGLGWLIKPFVTSIPKESLEMTMGSTRAALAAGRNGN
jgi:hypothetical protein